MKSYYEILEIDKTAGALDIKRAYFGMVKRFPPERFPNEFKKIREAYETLFNGEKRKEYDRQNSLPADAALMLDTAKGYLRRDLNKQAAEVLNKAVKLFPEHPIFKEFLANSLKQEDKIGLAIKIWEKLCEEFPNNANYIHELAKGYSSRGWHKKASEKFNEAVDLDDKDSVIWVDYIHCLTQYKRGRNLQNVCDRAINSVRKAGTENLLLYAICVECRIKNNEEVVREYLGSMKRLIKAVPVGEDHVTAVSVVLNAIMNSKSYSLFPLVAELESLLVRKDERLTKLMGKAEILCSIETIKDKGYNGLFHDLFRVKFNDCDCDDCVRTLTFIEFDILQNINTTRSQIIRLKNEFPVLYVLHEAFFNEVLETHDYARMINSRRKFLNKHFQPISSDVQTFRRLGPDPGRNDPCPCGSGKKYKKCCGVD